MAHSPAHSLTSSTGSVSGDSFLHHAQPVSLAVVQNVNIRSHVPVLLDLSDSNYSQRRVLIDSVLGKFGLEGHVRSPTNMAQRNAEWHQVDCCIVNWIYTTVNKGVFDIIYKPRASSFTIWSDIEGLFRDSKLQRAVYLEAEFCSVVQGDLNVNDYCSKLKRLADNLRDVGHPVSEPSQVLNLLRGLNKKYHHVKPAITSKSHTFMSARSYLLLEEIQVEHDDKTEAGHAYLVGHGNPANHGGNSSGTSGSSGSTDTSRSPKPKNKRRGRGPNPPPVDPTPGGDAPQRPPAPWTASYNR